MSPETRLVIVSGKGGVGKTVVSAALGRLLAAQGRRVLILEADPRENLHHLFGAEPSGGAVVPVGDRLAIRNANPRRLLDDLVRRRLRVGLISKRVIASPVYQHFADGAPGLREMMLLGHALEVTEGGTDHRADVVVIDAPASGHALALLGAPRLMRDAIPGGPIGAMAARIAGLVADSEACAIVLATLAEEMAVQETLETIFEVRSALGRKPTAVVANAIWPVFVPGQDDAALAELWRTRRAHNERELAALAAGWTGPIATVPLIGADFGPALLEGVAAALEPAFAPAEPAAAAPRRRRRREAAR